MVKKKLSKERVREEIREAKRNRNFYLILVIIFGSLTGFLWGSVYAWGPGIFMIIFIFAGAYEEYKYQIWKEEL